jgi:hypothetical protein
MKDNNLTFENVSKIYIMKPTAIGKLTKQFPRASTIYETHTCFSFNVY